MGKKKELREIKAQTKAIADRSKDLHLENGSRIAALLDAIEPSFAARIDEANRHIADLGDQRDAFDTKFSEEVRRFNDASLAFHSELDDLLGGYVHD